ncbi:hypothetical protein A3I27_01525 [Candidatus Giovannonibacteria bacterium RIFCSPLOWO2_02_FULL_43_11b]|nr:MAG: hypothetical protein A3I27_01525 [Candidatus Giovannonibacteria bacterium RIFCSPLOWO2_02_FULL_43_11b]OGF92382.1 MAG: hypothetical protein A3H04_01475 [Candidatus Giovannonibacteria bacterium RIFCSPLOWO2_12_FULL_43_11c]
MNWKVLVDAKARNSLERIPEKYSLRLKNAIDGMEIDPFDGDVEKLGGQENVWRKRIGAYRLRYEIYKEKKIVYIFKIERRTSSTY